MNTRKRCENSISECTVPDGKSCPGVHSGHVEHPSPEPVPRTRPPTANSTMVAAAVVRASFWKRFIGVGRCPAHDIHRGTAAALAILTAMAADPTAARPARPRRAPSPVRRRRSGRSSPACERRWRRVAPDALLPIDEVIRLVGAGGKRLRPVFCYWGYRAAGGVDGEPIERAAAALELLHTMALIHDDLMDRSPERRGAPSSAIQLAEQARAAWLAGPRARRRVPRAAGRRSRRGARRPPPVGVGVPTGPPGRRARSLSPDADRHGARAGPGRRRRRPRPGRRRRRSRAGPTPWRGRCRSAPRWPAPTATVTAALAAYGAPLGLAFQLLDDERDGDVTLDPGQVVALVAQARAGLDAPGLDPEAVRALSALADLVAAG